MILSFLRKLFEPISLYKRTRQVKRPNIIGRIIIKPKVGNIKIQELHQTSVYVIFNL